MADRHHIEAAIGAQEGLRGVVPDDVVDAALAVLRRQLADLDAISHRRRQVTVLFADVSGFTALSETLDPELLAARMNALWDRLDGEVIRRGGRVDKHMGDAVMALWGADATLEDDVERAVRAGLALQEALASFRSETGQAITMRVGINTGPALVGGVGTTAEPTAMGDAVNLASRLEHAAPVGGVLVSHDTYRHVRGVFDVEVRAPLVVRGKTEPVRTYLVRQAKPRAFHMPSRGIEGVETPTVGRDDEWAILQGQFEAAAAGAGARLVLVVGEAGVGKSRLLFDLESWIELRPEAVWLLQGRALPSRQRLALGLLRDVLSQRFGVLDSDGPPAVAAKLRAGFADLLDRSEAEAVGRWLGFDLGGAGPDIGGDGLAQAARAHLVRWLGGLARDEPAVLLLEDLHWADGESLAVLAELIDRLPEARLLVVGLTRPDLVDREPAWFDGSVQVVRVEVSPLDLETTEALVRTVLRAAGEVPDELVHFVAHRSDGNPFFVEELIKMLTERGVIRTDGADGGWWVDTGRVDLQGVPATLTGVLQARLDNLAPAVRAALQRAAVVGRVFWDASVTALDERPDGAPAGPMLEVATDREIVFRRGTSAFAGCGEYIFKHALLRDAAYETVLLRDRGVLHSRAAAWLARQAGERLGEYLDTIAEHHQLAGEPASAARCLHQSARAALDRGLALPARRSLEQAMQLWGRAGDDVPGDALVLLGDACLRTGDLDAADAVLATAAQTITDPGVLADALRHSGRVALERGDPLSERALLDEALRLIEPLDVTRHAQVLASLAWWELRYGDLNACVRMAEGALEAAERAVSIAGQIDSSGLLVVIATMNDDYDGALGHARTCMELARAGGDLAAEAVAHRNLGVTLHLWGDASGDLDKYRAAAAEYGIERSMRRDLGDRIGECSCLLNLAQARLRLGDGPGARIAITNALPTARALGAIRVVLFSLIVEADVRLTEGDTDGALALLGLVRTHPALERQDQDEIERILSRVTLDSATADAGLALGAGLDLDLVVDGMLAPRASG